MLTTLETILILANNILITIVIEGLAAYILGVRNKYDQLIILLINVATNLTLNTIYLGFMYISKMPAFIHSILLALEILVVYLEYLWFKKNLAYEGSKLKLSIVLNVASFVVGSAIYFMLFTLI